MISYCVEQWVEWTGDQELGGAIFGSNTSYEDLEVTNPSGAYIVTCKIKDD